MKVGKYLSATLIHNWSPRLLLTIPCHILTMSSGKIVLEDFHDPDVLEDPAQAWSVPLGGPYYFEDRTTWRMAADRLKLLLQSLLCSDSLSSVLQKSLSHSTRLPTNLPFSVFFSSSTMPLASGFCCSTTRGWRRSGLQGDFVGLLPTNIR